MSGGALPSKERASGRWSYVCPCGGPMGADRKTAHVYRCPAGHVWRRRYAQWTRLDEWCEEARAG